MKFEISYYILVKMSDCDGISYGLATPPPNTQAGILLGKMSENDEISSWLSTPPLNNGIFFSIKINES
jgi:hypothetical protein